MMLCLLELTILTGPYTLTSVNWLDFRNVKEDILQTKGFFHFSFWVMFYFFMVLIEPDDYPTWFILVEKMVDVSFFILIVYINILYLIPQFLQKRNLMAYLISLVGLVLIVFPILTLAYVILYRGNEIYIAHILNNKPFIFLRCLLVGLTSTGWKVTSDWYVFQGEKRELESQNLQSELKFLKSQINPHFFFNTLNNLYALALKKSDLAPEIVLRLSEMMRYMLYESNEKEVSLDKEVKYVMNYIELERLRQSSNFEIDFRMEGEASGQKIAPLMFIPFLENSFKHGLDNQIKRGFVHIKMKLKDNEVELDIENSKPPLLSNSNPNQNKSGGIGLENVKRRLKLLYPNRHVLNINDNPNSYKVFLNIQFS